jgi:hypothetical protein
MKSKINMFWYKMPNGENNFGDELGPYIVEKLSGLDVKYIPIVNNFVKTIGIYIVGLFKGDYLPKDVVNVVYSLNKEGVLLTAGSIISLNRKSTSLIWGAGLMNENEIIINANFYAVRGKYTQDKIKSLGYKAPKALGDPGLLLPIVYNPIVSKKYKLGIIPHYVHYVNTKELINSNDILVINLLDDVEKVVRDLKSCESTVSSSLHGIIESHAYGIPCFWINLPGSSLSGDSIKFYDYFSSVGINNYSPIEIDNLEMIDVEKIVSLIHSNCNIIAINKEIKIIQEGLLCNAPFEILKKYR